MTSDVGSTESPGSGGAGFAGARAGSDEPPICPVCGVTMVPAELSARGATGDWVCLECEETDGDDA